MTFSSNPTRPIAIRRGSNLTQEGVIRYVHIGVNRLASLDCEHCAWAHSRLIARHCCTAQGDSTSASSLSQQEPEVLVGQSTSTAPNLQLNTVAFSVAQCVLVDFNGVTLRVTDGHARKNAFLQFSLLWLSTPLRYHTARPSSVTSSWPGSSVKASHRRPGPRSWSNTVVPMGFTGYSNITLPEVFRT